MIDFFNPPDDQCQITSASKLYLRDGNGDDPADLSEEKTEHSVDVDNPQRMEVVFRPVDKVLYGPSDSKRADVFMHTTDRSQLYFIELKHRHAPGWFNEAVVQLKSVIGDFTVSHGSVCERAQVRRAYVCNVFHSRFAYSRSEDLRDFRRVTGFFLHPEGCVRIGK